MTGTTTGTTTAGPASPLPQADDRHPPRAAGGRDLRAVDGRREQPLRPWVIATVPLGER